MKIELFNIPSIDQYANRIIAQYIKCSHELSQGDILITDKISNLQDKSRHMLKSIDTFMNKNCLDPRVCYLYATRNKLSKFLQKIKENKLILQANSMKRQQIKQRYSSSKKQEGISLYKQNMVSFQKRQENKLMQNQNSDSSKRVQFITNLSEIKEFETEEDRNTPLNNKKLTEQKYMDAVYYPSKNKNALINNLYPKQVKTNEVKAQQKENGKAVTPIKTSKKVESFTPRKSQSKAKNYSNNIKSKRNYPNEQQSHILTNYQDSSNNKRNPSPSRNTSQKPMTKNISSHAKYHNNSNQKPEQIPSYLHNGEVDSSAYNQNKYLHKQFQESSAIKNLTNLIFTIKMTKQEYNQFMKIKEEHEGKPMFN